MVHPGVMYVRSVRVSQMPKRGREEPKLWRKWSMPNAETFTVGAIRDWIEEKLGEGGRFADPFVRNSVFKGRMAKTNDLNPEFAAGSHVDCVEFMRGLEEDSFVDADGDTWKVDDWLAKDRPEIIVYEDTTARSDHASFQDNLGTVTLGFGGLVDGYWCYHQTCDTLDEMEDWMDTTSKNYGEEQSGISNLVDSLDIITWWATYSFFHLDEQPIRNSYL